MQQKLAASFSILVIVLAIHGCGVADALSADKYVYKISNGELRLGSQLVGKGYSGKKGNCRNNPSCTSQKNVGPIPVGLYSIGQFYNSQKVGPLALPLTPIGGQNMFGRSTFLIHGDNAAEDASEGCVIMALNIREQISNGQVKKFDVIA